MKNRCVKRMAACALFVCVTLACFAALAETATPTPLPGGVPEQARPEPNDPAQTEAKPRGGLYDPSIFIIEASGTWRQEIARGYFVDFACEIYLDKSDPDDSRAADGLYNGALWLSTEVELSDYLKELLKDAPVEMAFEARGEGICDNLTVHLLSEYKREPWWGYAIPGDEGDILAPEQGLVAEGGLIAIAKEAYLEIAASGAQGEDLTHTDSRAGDAEITYIIHIAPDPDNQLTQRKALIHLYNVNGMSVTLEGLWRRIPGYPEDVLAYAQSGQARQMLDRHIP